MRAPGTAGAEAGAVIAPPDARSARASVTVPDRTIESVGEPCGDVDAAAGIAGAHNASTIAPVRDIDLRRSLVLAAIVRSLTRAAFDVRDGGSGITEY